MIMGHLELYSNKPCKFQEQDIFFLKLLQSLFTCHSNYFLNKISINRALVNLPLCQNKLKLCKVLVPPWCQAPASTFIPWGAEEETLSFLSCRAAHSSKFMVTLQVSSVLREQKHEVFLQSGVGFIFLSLSGSFLRTWLWKSAKNTREAACQCLSARQQNSFRHPLHKGTQNSEFCCRSSCRSSEYVTDPHSGCIGGTLESFRENICGVRAQVFYSLFLWRNAPPTWRHRSENNWKIKKQFCSMFKPSLILKAFHLISLKSIGCIKKQEYLIYC